MQPEQPSQICAEPGAHDVLALFTERQGTQRSVLMMREQLEGAEPPALLLVQGLEFVLYLASEAGSGLDEELLCEWLMDCYCYRHYKQQARDGARAEAQARLQNMELLYPGLAEAWDALESDDARLAHFLGREHRAPSGEADAETTVLALYRTLVTSWRALQVARDACAALDARGELWDEYRRLHRRLASYSAVKQEMKARGRPLFFVQGVTRLELDRTWPAAPKLAGRQLWALQLEGNHAVLEHLVHALRYPMELGGQFWPHRVEGRKVDTLVLEMNAARQLVLFDRRVSQPAHYTQRQLPQPGRLWRFAQARQLGDADGVLEPARAQSADVCYAELGGFAGVQERAASGGNTLPLRLAWLESAVLLCDYGARTEHKRPVTLADGLVVQRAQKPPKPAPRVVVDQKRKPDDELQLLGASSAKRKKHNTKVPLRQATLVSFTAYK